MLKKLSFALVIFALLLTACSSALQSQRTARDLASEPSAPSFAPLPEQPALESPTSNANGYSGEKGAYALDQSATSSDRLVIKNANLSLAVDDPQKSMDTISKMAESMGGFVVTAQMVQQTLENGSKVPQVNLTIRVPAERLDEALSSIKAETTQPVISENLNSQDVTAEYTDLSSRLVNLEAAEKQLQEIMASAIKTEDVLSVYSQLVSTREQIEVIKGQMKYYEQSAALSAITVQLIANAAMQPITIAGWQPKGVAKEALQSLIYTVQSLVNFGIRAVILYIPTLIMIFAPIALIIWGITALVKRSRRGRKTPAIAPEA